MLIVGIGSAGCKIADLFKQQEQYHVELLDEDKGIKKKNSVEEYDSIDYKPRKKAIKTATDGILFVCGAGKIAGATLRVLEGLKRVKMKVVYIYPDLEFSSTKEKKRNKVHFRVLQQYARSGLINELILMDNKIIMEQVGHGTVLNYFDKVNQYIYNIIHTLNYCDNVDPDFDARHELKEISRISTIGCGNFEENEEKLFFLLDNITETSYIININEEELTNDVSVLPNVKAMVKENKELDRETSFAIWSTEESESYFYTRHYTHFIQEKT
jgi:hypothetical protein